jgi:serine/threonine protein kinase
MIDRSGQQLGNYRVIRPIGRGGFADVYLGEHVYLKTQVAIKVLQTKVAGEDDLEGFLKEARTIAHLVHPHIVRVMDFGVDDQTPFLVMDYAPNGTLRQRHPKGSRIPLPAIVPYVRQIAAALQHAHDEKLIHRDVKPENMLLGKNGDVLLSDFGIALVAQSSRYQSTQDVIGTVAYMSPEQIQGKPRPASDQYSLGIVIYEWLSGDRPFHGSFTELCTQHMFAPPPALREKVSGIAPGVEQVIMTALAKEPKQRFASIGAFANAFEQASRATEPTILPPKPISSSPLAPTQVTEQEVPRAAEQISTPALPLVSTKEAISDPPLASTQAATPPLVSVKQTALSTQNDGAGVPRNNPSPVLAVPMEKSSGVGQKEQVERKEIVNVWGLDKRRVIVMGVWIVISVVLGVDGAYNFSIWSLSLLGFMAVAIIFGILFGPWVGLVSGGVGIFVDALIGSSYFGSINSSGWCWCAGVALMGFIAGLATVITQGRYNSFRKFAVAEIFGVLGMLIGLGIIFYGSYQLSYNSAWGLSEFISVGEILLVATLIIVPLVLGISNWIGGLLRRRRA